MHALNPGAYETPPESYQADKDLTVRRLAAYIAKLHASLHMRYHANGIAEVSSLTCRAPLTWHMCDQVPCTQGRTVLETVGFLGIDLPERQELGTRARRLAQRREQRRVMRERRAEDDE